MFLNTGIKSPISTPPTIIPTSKMTLFQTVMRAFGIYRRQSSGTNLLPLQNPESQLRGPDCPPDPEDSIQIIDEQMETIRAHLIAFVVEQHELKRISSRPCPEEEDHLETVASAMRGALRALREKRGRMDEQRANGKSLGDYCQNLANLANRKHGPAIVGWSMVWVKLRVMETSHAFLVLLYNLIEGRGERRGWMGLQLRGQDGNSKSYF